MQEPGGRALYPYSALPENFVQAIPLGSELAIVYQMYLQDVPTAFLQIIDSNGCPLYPDRGVAIYSDPVPGSIFTLRAGYYQGDFHFVWRKYVTGDNSHWEVRAQRISGGNSMWGQNGRVIRNMGTDRYVNVQDVQGNYFIWTEDYVVKALKLDVEGNPLAGWNPEGMIALDPTNSPYCSLEGSFLRGDDLGLIIKSSEMGQNYVKGQLINGQGQRLCGDIGVSLLPDYPNAGVVGFIYDDMLSLVFRNGNEVRLLRLLGAFTILGDPLGTVVYGDITNPSSLALVRYQDGSYSCFMALPVAGSSNDSNIYVQQLDSSGVQVGGLSTLCSAPFAQNNIHAAAFGSHSCAVWQDYRANLLESSETYPSIFGSTWESSFSSVDDPVASPQAMVQLRQPYPNPFSASTRLELEIKKPVDQLELGIYNLRGQLVKSLHQGKANAGIKQLNWDGRDDTGRLCSSGIYFINVRYGNQHSSQKMLYLRQ